MEEKAVQKYTVDHDRMEQVYERIQTPIKHGAVVKLDADYTDSPSVFYQDGHFYMYFISIAKDYSTSGYETHLAVSDDLYHWEILRTVLKRGESSRWDSRQVAGYAGFIPITLGELPEIQRIDGHVYIPYLAGSADGYETDPLCTGFVVGDDPVDNSTWKRLENPILAPWDADVRPGEEKTIYKSFMFEDPLQITGHRYVDVYNAKDIHDRERIFMAVSDDGLHWKRYGNGPILDQITDDPKGIICGDPQIVKIDDLYVMLYFRYRQGKGAYNTFACSYDLLHWTPWEGKPLIEPEEPWENIHAHKTWFLQVNGVNYHFYCAVNSNDERFIALATSQ